MNKEEIDFITGYEDLLKKGYCDCNEMNCLGYDSPKKILNIVKKLQQRNKQLKDNWDKLKEYCKTHYYGITTIGILEIMQELEKGENDV